MDLVQDVAALIAALGGGEASWRQLVREAPTLLAKPLAPLVRITVLTTLSAAHFKLNDLERAIGHAQTAYNIAKSLRTWEPQTVLAAGYALGLAQAELRHIHGLHETIAELQDFSRRPDTPDAIRLMFFVHCEALLANAKAKNPLR